jgi:hypothetical protein
MIENRKLWQHHKLYYNYIHIAIVIVVVVVIIIIIINGSTALCWALVASSVS